MLIVLLGLSLLAGLVEGAIDRQRGYQLVTLKSRMYWKAGEAVSGDRVKTWTLAVPLDVRLGGKPRDSRSTLVLWTAVFGLEDAGSSRSVQVKMSLVGQDELAGAAGAGAPFTLVLRNASPDPTSGVTYKRPHGASERCISSGSWVDYRGWMVWLANPTDLPPERVCAVVSGVLDRWTVHIDDLLSEESGQ
ncbi:MAG: hypothetical protein AB7S70_08890 [Hyphomicrobium sp.]|uniref:hypothetical protein n=1 Tax=Hyphomicrobium sp. TaxID=82 RepID=UPI003D0C7C1E